MPEPTVTFDPYERVDWSTVGHHRGILHMHPNSHKDTAPAHELVDLYVNDLGYTSVSISDSWARQTCAPWSNLSNIGDDHGLDWEDRDPEAMDAVDLAGFEGGAGDSDSENGHHLMGHQFETRGEAPVYNYQEENGIGDLETSIGSVADDGGWCYLPHCVRHIRNDPDNLSWEYYIHLFEQYDRTELLGIEAWNKDNPGRRSDPFRRRYDVRITLDNLLTHFAPARPIFGFGSDDSPGSPQDGGGHNYGNRFEELLLHDDEIDHEGVREAYTSGSFFFIEREQWEESEEPTPYPHISNIAHDEFAGTITVDGSGYDQIRWYSDGAAVHHGETINYKEQLTGSYLRFEAWPDPTTAVLGSQPWLIENATKMQLSSGGNLGVVASIDATGEDVILDADGSIETAGLDTAEGDDS